ncbi:hypothetical protein QSU92_01160 [Microbacterium sp. ET2]|uniref:hypothetical protein n=1 Tax=Microbacterium albipurpureum TaxID=3050384 RepID=UPI00259D1AA4|nr:hypothetical protein [Microbacterium sp. ET2 (Ac-2212)]WJL95865.1 hypothetical protein QSU92_01160 [Microbacterium sp. ET2 (Ac-2212)]
MTDPRTEIAEQTGIPASALRGTTRDELQAHADQLVALGYSTQRDLSPAEIVDRALGKTSDVDDIVNTALNR